MIAGRRSLLEEWGTPLTDDLAAAQTRAERDAKTAIAAGWDSETRAVFIVADQIKPNNAKADPAPAQFAPFS